MQADQKQRGIGNSVWHSVRAFSEPGEHFRKHNRIPVKIQRALRVQHVVNRLAEQRLRVLADNLERRCNLGMPHLQHYPLHRNRKQILHLRPVFFLGARDLVALHSARFLFRLLPPFSKNAFARLPVRNRVSAHNPLLALEWTCNLLIHTLGKMLRNLRHRPDKFAPLAAIRTQIALAFRQMSGIRRPRVAPCAAMLLVSAIHMQKIPNHTIQSRIQLVHNVSQRRRSAFDAFLRPKLNRALHTPIAVAFPAFLARRCIRNRTLTKNTRMINHNIVKVVRRRLGKLPNRNQSFHFFFTFFLFSQCVFVRSSLSL
eukprot:comp19057_c0_seq1/m.35297 comp19057_c0_seq1/g.35297  ORF comp19057_c0_seq1/g.35297 comp19057_c0_seq1/m.35297 type:complete len:314 (-) comp19057_c0_seq1:293-1234(-)